MTEDVNRVRSQGASAAIGAALLLYFGFVVLAEPERTGLFGWSAWMFFHTLRIGGVATAVAAALLWIGHPVALLFDAVVTLPIGILLIVTGIGMLVDGGGAFQSVINVACGALFISSGLHGGRVFAELRGVQPSDPGPAVQPDAARAETRIVPEALVGDSTASARAREAQPLESGPVAEGYLAALARKDPNGHDR